MVRPRPVGEDVSAVTPGEVISQSEASIEAINQSEASKVASLLEGVRVSFPGNPQGSE